jgi:hypothetical protein
MSKIVYNSFLYDSWTGAIDMDTDTFNILLVSSTYRAIADETKRDSHTKRSDITNEIAGTGYATGGQALTGVTVTKDTTNNIIKVDANDPSWTSATLTDVEGAVVYKARGGLASADELVGFYDLYADNGNAGLTTSNGTLTITWPVNGFLTLEPKSGS